ncbi:MAG TPA: hypothetical protein VFD58_19720 [Blastocatellia bacterium]|nr:hypothetical protein [Blastocatellia bacterium]
MGTIYLVIGGILLTGVLIVIAKFFFRLLKHVIIAAVLGGALMFFWYHATRPAPNPNIGKHAYHTKTGDYLGEVTGEANDPQRGPLWLIKQPDGMPTSYRKASVTLK